MKSVVLQCPQCGAPLNSDSSRCEFCGTTVRLSEDRQHFIGVSVTCPNCNANNHIGDKHCGSCGASLVLACPMPNCQGENGVWRKFCKKCGRNIAETQMALLEEDRATCEREIEFHTQEIKQIENSLPESKNRELLVKSIIGIVGGLIGFAVLASAGKGQEGSGATIGAIIIFAITAAIVWGYKSEEDYNLIASVVMHSEDLERLKKKHSDTVEKLVQLQAK